MKLAEAGDYRVEVHIDPTWGVFGEARYGLQHDGYEETITLDQGAASGWTELGTFAFAADGQEHLSLFDDVAGPVAADQHLVADAIRLTRVLDTTNPPATEIWETLPLEPDMAEPALAEIPDPTDPGDSHEEFVKTGCNSGSGSADLAGWCLFGGLLLVLSRRR